VRKSQERLPRLKPIVNSLSFAGLKIPLPLLKQGAPTVREPDAPLLLCVSRRDMGSYPSADLRVRGEH
jgi:hypothetical protein